MDGSDCNGCDGDDAPRGQTADIAGKWIAEISSPTLLEPAYARVTLERSGDTLSGPWGRVTVKGIHERSNGDDLTLYGR